MGLPKLKVYNTWNCKVIGNLWNLEQSHHNFSSVAVIIAVVFRIWREYLSLNDNDGREGQSPDCRGNDRSLRVYKHQDSPHVPPNFPHNFPLPTSKTFILNSTVAISLQISSPLHFFRSIYKGIFWWIHLDGDEIPPSSTFVAQA